jgi:hypothetical protein
MVRRAPAGGIERCREPDPALKALASPSGLDLTRDWLLVVDQGQGES